MVVIQKSTFCVASALHCSAAELRFTYPYAGLFHTNPYPRLEAYHGMDTSPPRLLL